MIFKLPIERLGITVVFPSCPFFFSSCFFCVYLVFFGVDGQIGPHGMRFWKKCENEE